MLLNIGTVWESMKEGETTTVKETRQKQRACEETMIRTGKHNTPGKALHYMVEKEAPSGRFQGAAVPYCVRTAAQ